MFIVRHSQTINGSAKTAAAVSVRCLLINVRGDMRPDHERMELCRGMETTDILREVYWIEAGVREVSNGSFTEEIDAFLGFFKKFLTFVAERLQNHIQTSIEDECTAFSVYSEKSDIFFLPAVIHHLDLGKIIIVVGCETDSTLGTVTAEINACAFLEGYITFDSIPVLTEFRRQIECRRHPEMVILQNAAHPHQGVVENGEFRVAERAVEFHIEPSQKKPGQ